MHTCQHPTTVQLIMFTTVAIPSQVAIRSTGNMDPRGMTQEEVFRGLQAEVAQLQEEEARLLRVTVDAQALEIERLRAQVEDLRQAQLSPYLTGLPHERPRTWREFGEERNRRCDYLTFQVIEPALDLVQTARTDMLTHLSTPAWTIPLEQAHNAMCEAERCLEDLTGEEHNESEDEEESEEDEEAEEEAEEESVATRAPDLGDAIEQDSDSDIDL